MEEANPDLNPVRKWILPFAFYGANPTGWISQNRTRGREQTETGIRHQIMSSSSSFPPIPSFHPFPNRNQSKIKNRRPKSPPISISTNTNDLNILHLRDLFRSTNHSCNRFPNVCPDGQVEPVDVEKLRLAVDNSSIVVSAFCRSKYCGNEDGGEGVVGSVFSFEQLFERAVPLPVEERRLVGFGRAVCDQGLTASIHDIVVTPPLQRLGIGRKIIQIIIRYLTSREIYDISALCSEKERSFFKSCGFGKDYLGATTMMYTRSALTDQNGKSIVKSAGRLALLVPQSRETFVH